MADAMTTPSQSISNSNEDTGRSSFEVSPQQLPAEKVDLELNEKPEITNGVTDNKYPQGLKLLLMAQVLGLSPEINILCSFTH
ncbi:hypothetical protein EIK77_010342 [Talaromyces pinophilus]|jgi:hypothetical protein|nr:hypothetical protein EIK77_010342 [Talaromyces pinophilus]